MSTGPRTHPPKKAATAAMIARGKIMATPRWNESRKRWELDVRINGKRHLFTSTAKGKAGIAEVRRKHTAAVEGVSDHKRLEAVWDDYLRYVDHIGGTANKAQREAYGRLYIIPALGYKFVDEITFGDWQDCILKVRPIKGKPLSKKAYSNLRSTIVNFCRWAYDHEMIERIPERLRLPASAETVGKKILMPDEIVNLFDVDSWYANSWRLMLVTGLRPGEAYGLQWSDIKTNVLTIRRAINSQNEVTKGKNKNANRTIVLGQIAQRIIADQRSKNIPGPWVFPDEDHDQARPIASQYWFQKLMGEHVSPYCLRHTFVSLTKNQLSDALMRQYVGHSKSMDTLGVYGKTVTGEMEQAADIIDLSMVKWLKAEDVKKDGTIHTTDGFSKIDKAGNA